MNQVWQLTASIAMLTAVRLQYLIIRPQMFMPLPPIVGSEGIMFSGRPSVRPFTRISRGAISLQRFL